MKYLLHEQMKSPANIGLIEEILQGQASDPLRTQRPSPLGAYLAKPALEELGLTTLPGAAPGRLWGSRLSGLGSHSSLGLGVLCDHCRPDQQPQSFPTYLDPGFARGSQIRTRRQSKRAQGLSTSCG